MRHQNTMCRSNFRLRECKKWGAKTAAFVSSHNVNKTNFKTLSNFVVDEAILPGKFYKVVIKGKNETTRKYFFSRGTEVHLIRRYIQS